MAEADVDLLIAAKNVVNKPGKCPLEPALFDDWKFDVENFDARSSAGDPEGAAAA